MLHSTCVLRVLLYRDRTPVGIYKYIIRLTTQAFCCVDMVTVRRVLVTIVAVGKQQLLHILNVCL